MPKQTPTNHVPKQTPTNQEFFYTSLGPQQATAWKALELNEFERNGSYLHSLYDPFPGSCKQLVECELPFEKIHAPWFKVWENNCDHHMGPVYFGYRKLKWMLQNEP